MVTETIEAPPPLFFAFLYALGVKKYIATPSKGSVDAG